MSNEHYFTATPSGEVKYRHLTARLANQKWELTTANGIFSPDRIDPGTHVLLSCVPPPPLQGNLLDVGCGWGPLTLSLAFASPHATVWAIDTNERARDLTRINAEKIGLTNVRTVLPSDVPSDITFETIWSNPPIRVGKKQLHVLLLTWLPRLQAGGDAWMVVHRNLGADSLQGWLNDTLPNDFLVNRTATDKGYRILNIHRTNPVLLPPTASS